jgi:hypothetical protein
MRRVRVLGGWRLWTTVGLFSCAFFLSAFSLAKVFAPTGGRWDISWASVAWLAVGTGLAVFLWTLLDPEKKK